jgi:hypothetical protein
VGVRENGGGHFFQLSGRASLVKRRRFFKVKIYGDEGKNIQCMLGGRR